MSTSDLIPLLLGITERIAFMVTLVTVNNYALNRGKMVLPVKLFTTPYFRDV